MLNPFSNRSKEGRKPAKTAPGRLNPLARISLRSETYNIAQGRLSQSKGLLTKYASISGSSLGASARSLVDLNLMDRNDPRAIAAQDMDRGRLSRSYTRQSMIREQKSLLAEISRAGAPAMADRTVRAMNTMLKQNQLNPYQAAANSEHLSIALRRAGKEELAVKAATSAIRAGGLHLFEEEQARKKNENTRQATSGRKAASSAVR